MSGSFAMKHGVPLEPIVVPSEEIQLVVISLEKVVNIGKEDLSGLDIAKPPQTVLIP